MRKAQTQATTQTLSSTSSKLSTIKSADENSCFVIQSYTDGNSYNMVQNSSQYYSTVAASFTVQNTCSTPQTMSAVEVDVNNFQLNKAPVNIGWITQSSSNPYLTLSYTSSGNDFKIALSTPACTGDYCSWAQFPANSSQSFTLNGSIGSAITSASIDSITINGGDTPPTPPTQSGDLSLNIDTTALQSLCSNDNSCNLKLDIIDSNGSDIEQTTVNPFESSNYSVLYTENYTNFYLTF